MGGQFPSGHGRNTAKSLTGFYQNLFPIVSLLRFPSQKRTFSEPKTYGFRTKTVRFWYGNRRRMPAKTEIQKKYSQIIYSIFNIRLLYKRHKSLCVPVTPCHPITLDLQSSIIEKIASQNTYNFPETDMYKSAIVRC